MCICVCVSAPFSLKRPHAKTRSTPCCIQITIGITPTPNRSCGHGKRTRYHIDTTVSILVIHSTHHYRFEAKSQVLKPKCAQHVSLYDCYRLCHRLVQLPIARPQRSRNIPNLASTSHFKFFTISENQET